MRVPVLEQSRVQSADLPGNGAQPLLREAPNFQASIQGAGKGLAEGLDKAANALTDEALKAEKEASAFAEANALLEQQERFNRLWDGDSTKKTPGFSSLKGDAAMGQSAAAIERLEADRKELASKLADPRARQRFELRSREAMLAMRKQVETHAGKQHEAARSDLLKARMAQAIGMASAGVPDVDSWLSLSYQVEEDIVANAGSPEEGKLLAQSFRGQNGLAMLKGLLDQGRVDEAKQFLAENKQELSNGGTYDEAAGVLKRATAGEERDRRVSEAAKLVDTTAESLRHESAQAGGGGYVDGEALRGAVKLEETDPEIRAEVKQALEDRIRREEQRRLDDVKEAISQVELADVERRLPGRHVEFLKQHPEGRHFLAARQAAANARAAMWAARGRAKASKADADRLRAMSARQKELDRAFVWEARAALRENPDADVTDLYVDFVASHLEQGEEVDVGEAARSQVGFYAADYRKRAQTEEGRQTIAAENRDAREFRRVFTDLENATGKKLNRARVNERIDKAMQQRADELAKGKTTMLTTEQFGRIKADLIGDVDITKPGWLWDSTEKVPKVDTIRLRTGRPTATGKNGEKYQLSEDGKTWERIK